LKNNYDKAIELINDKAAESIETDVSCFKSGFYQIISFIFISVAWTASLGLYGYLDVFVGYTPNYKCDIDKGFTDSSNFTIKRSQDECTYEVIAIKINSPNESSTYDCNKWIYDQTVMKSTKISEFDLICKKNYVFETAYSVEQLGYVVGTLIFRLNI
jgi:hypothetical protein